MPGLFGLASARDPDQARHDRTDALYRLSVSARWLQQGLVTALLIATALAGAGVWRAWNERDLQVFSPLPGLVYADPDAAIVPDAEKPDQPLTFQRLSAEKAFEFNASVPVSSDPLIPARPFFLPVMDVANNNRALDCLTAAVYYEAASERLEGQQAVAQVVLNRVRHPVFPHSVCGVVFSGSSRRTGCQFTFTCDGSLGRSPDPRGWLRARAVAQAALNGFVARSVGQATHYHTLWVAPYWSPSLVKLANIGRHTFYRWAGANGLRSAFGSAYAGSEPLTAVTTGDGDADMIEGTTPALLEPPPVYQFDGPFQAPVTRPVLPIPAPRPSVQAADLAIPDIGPTPQPSITATVVEPAPLVPEQRSGRRIARSTSW